MCVPAIVTSSQDESVVPYHATDRIFPSLMKKDLNQQDHFCLLV